MTRLYWYLWSPTHILVRHIVRMAKEEIRGMGVLGVPHAHCGPSLAHSYAPCPRRGEGLQGFLDTPSSGRRPRQVVGLSKKLDEPYSRWPRRGRARKVSLDVLSLAL